MEFLLAAAGFAMLIKGADWLVESAKRIALTLGVPRSFCRSCCLIAFSVYSALRGA